MKSMNIKGKEYIGVNERIKELRNNEKYTGFSIETEIISNDGDTILFKATIKNAEGRVLATGHAHETKSDDYKEVNSTSHVENAETSAVGRALGMLGIGIDTSVATAEEVSSAVAKQEYRQSQPVVQRRLAVQPAPQPLSPTQQTMAAINSDEAYPKFGDEAVIDGVPCVVRRNKNTGELFWAATNSAVKFTRHIGPER